MEKILKLYKDPNFYTFIGYIVFAFVLYFIIKKVIIKKKFKNKRQKTIQNLVLKIIKYTIIIITILICLDLIGINVTSFIAGLGIAGVVVGLALQDIMKDVLSGIFIIVEDYYDLGDIVEINSFTGEVIALEVKITKLKSYDGRIKIISNRDITEVVNYSICDSKALVDVPLSYEENLENVDKVLNQIIIRIKKEVVEITGEVLILGIDKFSDSAIIYKLMAEVKPAEHVSAQRKMQRIIKEELDKNNITIPYNKIEVLNGNKDL